MKKLKNKNGFTLIELIMVMIILGILSAVAIPRYLETIQKAEEAAEDAVISNISVALENYGVHKLIDSGRAIWPDNPFDALKEKPSTYTNDGTNADSDNPIACRVLRIDGQVPSPTPSVGMFGDSISDTLIDGVPAESRNSLARIQAVNQPAVPPPTITMCSMGLSMEGSSVSLFRSTD